MKEQEFTLNIVRVREVNVPTKSYAAAGFDFYMPTKPKITTNTLYTQANNHLFSNILP